MFQMVVWLCQIFSNIFITVQLKTVIILFLTCFVENKRSQPKCVFREKKIF